MRENCERIVRNMVRSEGTRSDTRHKMCLVSVLFTFENNSGHTDRRTYGRTDTTSYKDATAHLKAIKLHDPVERQAIPPRQMLSHS